MTDVLPAPKYKIVESLEELTLLFDKMIESKLPFAFDIETGYKGDPRASFSLHPETAFVVGFSFCWSYDAAYYVPLEHDFFESNLDKEKVAILFWEVLQTGLGVPHNAKFELRHLAKYFRLHLSSNAQWGQHVISSEGYFPIKGDTFLMSYCIAEFSQHGLKHLTKIMFGHNQTELHDLFPGLPKNKQATLRFNTLELSKEVIDYACEDSYWTLRLYYSLPELILSSKDNIAKRVENFKKIYAIEMNCLLPVCHMEDFGIALDWGMIKKASVKGTAFKEELNVEIQEELSDILGESVDINLSSHKQMSELLFEKLALTTKRMTASSKNTPAPKMSTDSATLLSLSSRFPVLKKVVQWREMKTLLTRYLTNYEKDYSYADDGRIHPDLYAAGTVTGRFSAAHPNYQQLPKRYYFKLNAAVEVDLRHEAAHGDNFSSEKRNDPQWRGLEFECKCGEFEYPMDSVFDFNFRNALICPEDYVIFGFDYAQAELRAIAGEAGETALLNAFKNGTDPHKLTASMMLHKEVTEITKVEREKYGKTLGFALTYGLSPESLGERNGFSTKKAPGERQSEAMREGQKLFDSYYAVFPNIKRWQDREKQNVKNGFVYTKFGRRIPLWDLKSDKRWIRNKADRVAINGPIQGGATGDNVKRAMAECFVAIQNDTRFKGKVHLVMNIHDALEFYSHKTVDLFELWKVLNPIIEAPVEGWAPMKAEWHIADRWGEQRELVFQGDALVTGNVKTISQATPDITDEEEAPEFISISSEPESRTIAIQMAAMPTLQQYSDFLDLIKAHPGINVVKLLLPQGTVPLEVKTSLVPSTNTQRAVSLCLGGARMYYVSDSIDNEAFQAAIGI